MTTTASTTSNFGTPELRRAAAYMASELSVPAGAEDPALAQWIHAELSDQDFSTRHLTLPIAEQDADAVFAPRRTLALMIARATYDNGGQVPSTDLGLIQATMAGIQTLDDLIEQLGPWDGVSQGPDKPRLDPVPPAT